MDIVEAFRWIVENHDAFFTAFNRHLLMCLLSLGIAILIAIPLGFLVARSPRAAFVTTNIAGAARSIPSLAILAAAMTIMGIGLWPSVIALIVLAIPPLLLNTIIGIREVDPASLDAAKGMGLGRFETLWQVELPLAVPSILAGVRTAAIQVIGGAALASFIGGGGLGDFINMGIAIMDMPRLLVGAVPIALLAIATELGFGWLERHAAYRR
ncbi:ABC transporter permease [Paracoccus aminophilus]|uniref:Osmoprotectant transport system, permease protein n=1 Tax=Paracoccus aminophilus JCM 7686 TaxID=1367847 RepID=S5YBU7_PARAH|nr:ABC transporter permease [Paracoccus aminophilus]AGT08928.1 osmoprotectant transport system, permease protein [Paracoccus aminophilus JCM 7686]